MNLDEIMAALDGLDPESRQSLLAEAEAVAGSVVWLPNSGPQTDAFFCEADELFYGGQAGGGKALEINSLVLTPTGWAKIGALKVGSKVCGTDGTVQEVIGVFPQGVRPLYRVTMRDGASVLADPDHQWLAWRTHSNSKKNNVITSGPSSARKWTTAQMFEEMSQGRRADGRTRGFALPVTAPVRFSVAGQLKGRGKFVGREIDPYLLGLTLGDGCIQPKTVSVVTEDPEIAERIYAIADEGSVRAYEIKPGLNNYHFRGGFLVGLRTALQRLDLAGTKAHDKFIPRQYLFAPEDVRWELLRGLMDTDGWAEPKRALYFCSVSERLAEDVKHLVMSLGGVASSTDRIPTYTHNGERREGQRAYTVRIKLPNPEKAFALTRKREVARGLKHQCEGRIVESIEYERDGEAVCIAVSNPNSLYITEGFIVTHNSALGIGLSLTQHKRSLLLRRTNKESRKFVEEVEEVLGHRSGFNGQDDVWRLPDRTLDFGGCQLEEDKQKYKGNPHDLIFFDEVSDFTESQYVFITTWNRSADPKQRCRVLAAGNPPTSPEGLWVLQRWAAWLDPTHPNPAEPGDLRWFTSNSVGDEIEVDGPGPHLIDGEEIVARSRTFIPGKLSDNPDLARTNYASVLAALPAELRAAYRDGRFDAGLKDRPFQLVPTAWVKAAQARWTDRPPNNIPMCAMGVDCTGGGEDPMVIAPRYDGWFAPMVEIPGREIPADKMGSYAGGQVIAARRDNATVIIDMGGGYGGALFEHLRSNLPNEVVKPYKGAGAGYGRTSCGQFGFNNARSAALWKFREALDPGQPGGSVIALPPDPELVADLTAPTWKPDQTKIVAETKVEVCKRLGRSTNKGDAVVMAWTSGLKGDNIQGGFNNFRTNRAPQVLMGRAPLSAQRRR